MFVPVTSVRISYSLVEYKLEDSLEDGFCNAQFFAFGE